MFDIKNKTIYFNELILSSGMYLLNISCQFNEPNIIGIFINQNEEIKLSISTSNIKFKY